MAALNTVNASESRTAAPVLVLGLGNDILTDDAIGLLIARELKRRLADDSRVEVQETTEMGLALLDLITGHRVVVIIDSIQTGQGPPGTIHELDPAAFKAFVGATPHFLGVSETIELGKQLGLPMPDTVKILGVEVADPFTLGTKLSPALAAALPGLMKSSEGAIRELGFA